MAGLAANNRNAQSHSDAFQINPAVAQRNITQFCPVLLPPHVRLKWPHGVIGRQIGPTVSESDSRMYALSGHMADRGAEQRMSASKRLCARMGLGHACSKWTRHA